MSSQKPIVLKFGGSNFAPEALDPFAQALAKAVAAGRRFIVVHGGGKDLTALLDRLGTATQFVEGHRVTDPTTLDAAELVLSGRVNKRITRAMLRAGIKAVGIAGTDGGLIRAKFRRPVKKDSEGKLLTLDLGRTGDVEAVDTSLLEALANTAFVPVVSPLALGPDGEAMNVNADSAAGAIAAAMQGELRLVTNVPGVLTGGQAEPLGQATASEIEALKTDGTIRDGMIPKVDACLGALAQGAASAFIQSLDAFLAGHEKGTRIVAG